MKRIKYQNQIYILASLVTASSFDVDSAILELKTKSIMDIQKETAYKWASRSIASYKLGNNKDAEEYRHEALEHAALVDDSGGLLKEISSEINKFRIS